jgi:hypothetical protein
MLRNAGYDGPNATDRYWNQAHVKAAIGAPVDGEGRRGGPRWASWWWGGRLGGGCRHRRTARGAPLWECPNKGYWGARAGGICARDSSVDGLAGRWPSATDRYWNQAHVKAAIGAPVDSEGPVSTDGLSSNGTWTENNLRVHPLHLSHQRVCACMRAQLCGSCACPAARAPPPQYARLHACGCAQWCGRVRPYRGARPPPHHFCVLA